MDSLLTESLERFLTEHCKPELVRSIEAGGGPHEFWQQINDSGFADALTSEENGGAGLSLAEANTIFKACGRHAVPSPLAYTIALRAGLADAGIETPDGPVTIASGHAIECSKEISLMQIPFGASSDWVLAELGDTACLLPLRDARTELTGINRSLMCNAYWNERPKDAIALPNTGFRGVTWRVIAAALNAAQMSGAMDKLMEMTLEYANQRIQFGKPIGKLQVIQQQLSVMAEQTFAANTAAQIGLSGNTPQTLRAAVAKARVSAAVVSVASICHAVHGAIGVTEEYDLQLYTRRLHEWRSQYGSESYWNKVIGEAMLAEKSAPLQFIQQIMAGKLNADVTELEKCRA